jgi:hypothetical protein
MKMSPKTTERLRDMILQEHGLCHACNSTQKFTEQLKRETRFEAHEMGRQER